MPQRLGKYTLIKKLATGGMAEVFLARAEGPMGFAKKLVVKRILPHFGEDAQFVQMFLGEATIAAQLDHPNIVQIFDFGQADGQYFIAMELIDGPNLRALNHLSRELEGPLPLHLAARLISLACEGLHFAHEAKDDHGQPLGLVHRDISPDNIMVSRAGSVKVVDFGIAKASTGVHKTKSGVIKGKLAYMSPEQLAAEPLDRRADVYALGVTLYDLSCGQMPFDSSSEVSIIQAIMNPAPLMRLKNRRPDIPEALDGIVARCLAKNPNDRYASCKELQADLELFIQSTRQSAYPSDLAAVVQRLFPPAERALQEATGPVSDPGGAATASDEAPFAPTLARPSSGSRNSPGGTAPAASAPAIDSTVQTQAPDRAPPQRSLVLPFVAGAAVVGLAAAAAYFAFRPAPVEQPLPPPPPIAATAVDAGATKVTVQVVEVVDAGSAARIDARSSAEPADAGTTHAVVHSPRVAQVEFRVRPFAKVFLDGKLLGETPLDPINVPLGRHKLRLVNEALGKDVALNLDVPAGGTVFKYNLKD